MSAIVEVCADCGAPVQVTPQAAIWLEVDRAMGEDAAVVCVQCMDNYVCHDCGEDQP